MKENLVKPDFILLGAAASILVLGILILSSASAFLAQSRYHDSYYLLKHQILLGVIPGLVLGFINVFACQPNLSAKYRHT